MTTKDDSGLGLELIELAHALESARLISDLTRARALTNADDARLAPRAVSATVGLVAERLRALAARLSEDGAPPRRRK